MSQADKSRRQKAAAAQSAAQAAERRRERTIRIAGAVTVLVVVVGIIAIALFARGQDDTANGGATSPTASADPSAPVPAGVLDADAEFPFAVPFGAAAADAPKMELWFDYQCPACASVEVANGQGIIDAASSGDVQLFWRPTAFLDANLGNDSSSRAIAAWGCAIDAGKTAEYHQTLFANHPTPEGTGYTDEQLLGYASDAGITGDALTTFTQCVNDGTYLPWAANSTQTFYDASIPGTPHATINGTEIENSVLADPTAFAEAVAAAKQ